MRARLLNLFHCNRGSPAVEFALVLPLMLLIVTGMIEMGKLLADQSGVEKGVRAAAMYAARLSTDPGSTTCSPFGATERTAIRNVAMYGNPGGTGSARVDGWTDPSTIEICARNETVNGTPVVVLRIEATVNYQPLIPGLFDGFVFGDYTSTFVMKSVNDQAYVGS